MKSKPTAVKVCFGRSQKERKISLLQYEYNGVKRWRSPHSKRKKKTDCTSNRFTAQGSGMGKKDVLQQEKGR